MLNKSSSILNQSEYRYLTLSLLIISRKSIITGTSNNPDNTNTHLFIQNIQHNPESDTQQLIKSAVCTFFNKGNSLNNLKNIFHLNNRNKITTMEIRQS